MNVGKKTPSKMQAVNTSSPPVIHTSNSNHARLQIVIMQPHDQSLFPRGLKAVNSETATGRINGIMLVVLPQPFLQVSL